MTQEQIDDLFEQDYDEKFTNPTTFNSDKPGFGLLVSKKICE